MLKIGTIKLIKILTIIIITLSALLLITDLGVQIGFQDDSELATETVSNNNTIIIKEDQIIIKQKNITLDKLSEKLSSSQEPIQLVTENARLKTYRQVTQELEDLGLNYFESNRLPD